MNYSVFFLAEFVVSHRKGRVSSVGLFITQVKIKEKKAGKGKDRSLKDASK